MLDTTNEKIRRVITPIGPGMLRDFDKEADCYLVHVLKKDCTIPLSAEASGTLRLYKAEELNEL